MDLTCTRFNKVDVYDKHVGKQIN